MKHLWTLGVLMLAAFVAAGCGQAPEGKDGELPDLGTNTESPRRIDERMRGTLKHPRISGVITLRPDKSVLETERLQISGQRDTLRLFCVTDPASSEWWNARVTLDKEVWSMEVRPGRTMDPVFAAQLAGNPGCMIDAGNDISEDPLLMPLVPLEAQPRVYEGTAGDTNYTLTLPAHGRIDQGRLQIDPPLSLQKGRLSCMQVVGDSAGGALASAGAGRVVPVKVPKDKKFASKKIKAAFIAKLKLAAARKAAAVQGAGIALAQPKTGLPDVTVKQDPNNRRKTITIYGIVGQTGNREPARLGGMWCGLYMGGKGYAAKYDKLAKMQRVLVTTPNVADDPDSVPNQVADILTDSGARGVRITDDKLLIERSGRAPAAPQTAAMIQTDEALEQVLDSYVLVYATAQQAKLALVALKKQTAADPIKAAAYPRMTAQCTTVLVGGAQGALDESPDPDQEQQAIEQLDEIQAALTDLCPPPVVKKKPAAQPAAAAS